MSFSKDEWFLADPDVKGPSECASWMDAKEKRHGRPKFRQSDKFMEKERTAALIQNHMNGFHPWRGQADREHDCGWWQEKWRAWPSFRTRMATGLRFSTSKTWVRLPPSPELRFAPSHKVQAFCHCGIGKPLCCGHFHCLYLAGELWLSSTGLFRRFVKRRCWASTIPRLLYFSSILCGRLAQKPWMVRHIFVRIWKAASFGPTASETLEARNETSNCSESNFLHGHDALRWTNMWNCVPRRCS